VLHVRFLYQDLLGFVAQGLHLRFFDVLTALQLLYPLVDIEALLLGRHVVYFRNYN
jgi:hypothetical protein